MHIEGFRFSGAVVNKELEDLYLLNVITGEKSCLYSPLYAR